MKGFHDMIFLSEIVLQSKIAQRAFERLLATNENFDRLEVWCSIQSILVATGNVSKILWPIKNVERGERLRHMLKVGSDNILSNRTFRNYFEHYDERIDKWYANSSSITYSDLAMNPSLRGGFSAEDHRGYNSFDNSLIFRGERLDLNKVLDALSEIHDKCKPYVLDIF